MSRFGHGGDFRSSAGNLSYGGSPEPRGGGSERWDSERFMRERERAERVRGPPIIERERFEEIDRYESPRGGRGGGGSRIRESSADEVYYGRGGARIEEKDRYFMEEKFGPPPARRPARGPGRYYDEDPEDADDGRMVPFERKKIVHEREFTSPPPRRGGRPGFIRRQSSLDTFDRKPLPRYGDRMVQPPPPPPEVITIPASRTRREPREPARYLERDFEDIRIAEPDYYGDEEFRGYRETEKSTVRRRRAESDAFEFREEREEIIEEEEPFPKKGKTRMPRRLVNKRAVIEMGYPFEEEEETIIILRALGKDQIDEVIKISREMGTQGGGESRTQYMIEAPPLPPPEPPQQVIERRTEIITIPPPDVPRSIRDWDDGGSRHDASSRRDPSPSIKSSKSRRSRKSHKSSKSHKSKSRKAESPPSSSSSSSSSSDSDETTIAIRKYAEEEKGQSNEMHTGPLALFVPQRSKSVSRRNIQAEIKALDEEKKALKNEREMEKHVKKAERYLKEEKDRDGVVKIEKDRKASASNSKVLKAMLATLT